MIATIVACTSSQTRSSWSVLDAALAVCKPDMLAPRARNVRTDSIGGSVPQPISVVGAVSVIRAQRMDRKEERLEPWPTSGDWSVSMDNGL